MSLELSNSPGRPTIKIWFDDTVYLYGDDSTVIDITMKDFCAAMYYVLTNTPIVKDDPRLKFLDVVKELKLVPNKTMVGWPVESKTLQYEGTDCFSLSYPGSWKEKK